MRNRVTQSVFPFFEKKKWRAQFVLTNLLKALKKK